MNTVSAPSSRFHPAYSMADLANDLLAGMAEHNARLRSGHPDECTAMLASEDLQLIEDARDTDSADAITRDEGTAAVHSIIRHFPPTSAYRISRETARTTFANGDVIDRVQCTIAISVAQQCIAVGLGETWDEAAREVVKSYRSRAMMAAEVA